jgi:Fur family transcriptional regulator, ferric uptake regulator
MTASSLTPPLEFDSPETVLNALRGHGLRVSTARRLVVHTLFAADGPVSAEEIATGLGGRATPVDLTSVYRNLEKLEEIGVVRHVHAGHAPGRYVLSGGGEREYLACDRCGVLIEADPRDLERVRAEVRSRFGLEPRFTHFPIVGLCGACAGEGSPR